MLYLIIHASVILIFTYKDVFQQAKFVGIKIVAHSRLEQATFGLQNFRFPI